MGLTELSRYMCLILRHHPEVIGITLDEHGWADVEELIAGIAEKKNKNFNREMLEEIVRMPSVRTGRRSGQIRAIPSRWMWSWSGRSRRNFCTTERAKNMRKVSTRRA